MTSVSLNISHTWAGIEVSTEDIKQAVSEVVEENKSTILELRYRTNGSVVIDLIIQFWKISLLWIYKFKWIDMIWLSNIYTVKSLYKF